MPPSDLRAGAAPRGAESTGSAAGRRNGIILHGYYGCGNLGDDLLLTVVIAGLRPLFPGCRFLVRDCGDNEGLAALGPDVSFTGIEMILMDRRRGKFARVLRYFAAWWRLLGQSRWLVLGGGTVFHAVDSLRSLQSQWIICALARARGVRIAALGVGVSDLPSPAARRWLRSIIGMTELFLVRDESGLAQCAGTPARLGDDLVFAWQGLPERGPPTGKATIALTVVPAAFRGATLEHAAAALADAVRHWLAHGHGVVFVIFLRAGVTQGDDALFDRITAHIDRDRPVEIRRPTASAKAISAALGDVDLVCGMRFHGLVLAATLGRPFVGLAHDNKVWDICRRFDMPCLDARGFTGAGLAAAAEGALDRRPDRALVERCAAGARRNFAALAALLP
ncbi:MAG TPA: polysaccharide pyruvyl transferase family protein [Stellaceae bacterium]|nr:polysaccharide pyruvyl transferase family protein [Stellaceae bacterium]